MLSTLALVVLQARIEEPLPRDPRLFREWVTVGTNGVRYAERLRLMPDGQFVTHLSGHDIGRSKKLYGFYVYGRLRNDAVNRLRENTIDHALSLFVSTAQTKELGLSVAQIARLKREKVKAVPYRILVFEPMGPILHDFVTVVFAPKGQEAHVRRLLEKDRKASLRNVGRKASRDDK